MMSLMDGFRRVSRRSTMRKKAYFKTLGRKSFFDYSKNTIGVWDEYFIDKHFATSSCKFVNLIFNKPFNIL